MDRSEYEIRPLNIQDLEGLVALTDKVEWYFPRKYWKILLATGWAFGLFSPEKELAATTAIFDYGENLSFLGVVIVCPEFRGRGLASVMMNKVEHHLEKPATPIALIATPEGKPVYENRGYQIIGECIKFKGGHNGVAVSFPSLDDYRFKPLNNIKEDDLVRFDRDAFGADRSHVLAGLLAGKSKSIAMLQGETDKMVGFGFTTKRKGVLVVGPVVADELFQATAIVQMLIYGWSGPLRIDVLSHQGEFHKELLNLGFEVEEISPVMQLGVGDAYKAQPKAFALTSQALG